VADGVEELDEVVGFAEEGVCSGEVGLLVEVLEGDEDDGGG
jgi:hypothetical protein